MQSGIPTDKTSHPLPRSPTTSGAVTPPVPASLRGGSLTTSQLISLPRQRIDSAQLPPPPLQTYAESAAFFLPRAPGSARTPRCVCIYKENKWVRASPPPLSPKAIRACIARGRCGVDTRTLSVLKRPFWAKKVLSPRVGSVRVRVASFGDVRRLKDMQVTGINAPRSGVLCLRAGACGWRSVRAGRGERRFWGPKEYAKTPLCYVTLFYAASMQDLAPIGGAFWEICLTPLRN